MKKTLLSLFALCAAFTATAQTNLLENGGFESWTDGTPDCWKSTSTASNATLEQSTEAHTGNYSVLVMGDPESNKRLSYKELTLKPGTYTFSCYAKMPVDGDSVTLRPGYALWKTDGSGLTYFYGASYTEIGDTWSELTYEFTLTDVTKLNMVIMNNKTRGKKALVDDASLVTEDGGLAEEGELPQPDLSSFVKANAVVSGNKYLLVASNKVATPLASNKSYGYLNVVDAQFDNNVLKADETNAFTFVQEEEGYTIVGSDGRYLYQTGTYNSFNVTDTPTEGQYWSVAFNDDETAKITNLSVNKYIQYSEQYTSFGSYATENGVLPTLYVLSGTGTGIDPVVTAPAAKSGIYSLDGRRLNRLQKGINIVNGKKVYVR